MESNSSVPVSSQRPLGRPLSSPLWLDLLQTDMDAVYFSQLRTIQRGTPELILSLLVV